MTPLYDTQEFYKKMSELQERLRKSEDERMKLEERFNLLSQDSRSRREACINKLRMRYIDFLEEQRLRDERNHQILGSLDKIDGSLARMTAKTDRLGILRKQYEAYLLRVYANRSTGGGTGDSGVGSHNEERSPKSNILPTERNPPSLHRRVTQNRGNSPSSTPQTSCPRPDAGGIDVPPFNQPRYAAGQETLPINTMRVTGQGDGPTIMQPYCIRQYFCGSQNSIIERHSPSSGVQQMPNALQEFAPSNRNHPQRFTRSNNLLPPNSAHTYHRQLQDISNSQYLENPRSSYPGDPPMTILRNFTKSQEFTSSDMQTSDLHPDRANTRSEDDFSADLAKETFGACRQSTPLPGYLDYSNRYSRNPPVCEPNVGLHYGFTRSDLEKVMQKKEQILPTDYLHNPETFKPSTHTSKLSSSLEEHQKAADTNCELSSDMNNDELDQYIRRIRSLHRHNDQSLDGIDIEQNTSGDLLNATLSDDAPDQHTLHSDDKIRPNTTQIISDGVKSVLALADDFVAKTANSNAEFQVKNDLSNDRKISDKSGIRSETREEDVVAKPALTKSNDPSLPVVNSTFSNLSISATRDEVHSDTASFGVNQIQDTCETSTSKLRSETPLIADKSWLNSKGAATISQNNPADPNNLLPSTRHNNEVLNFTENTSVRDKKSVSKEKNLTELQNIIQQMPKSADSVPKETEVHEDIEGDKVKLIDRDETREQVDFVRELQPPSLQHYEKNVVKICVGDEDENNTVIPKVVHETSSRSEIQGKEENVAEPSSQESTAYKMLGISKEQINQDLQYQKNAESKHQLNTNDEYPVTCENLPRQNLILDEVDENGGGGQRIEQNLDTEYNNRQTDDESNHRVHPYIPTSDKPYGSHDIYHAHQQYETDPNQVYAQKPNPEFSYGPDQQFDDDSNAQYAAGSAEQYGVNPNEQYTIDSNEEYAVHPNQQYTSDSTEQYAVDPNEQYAVEPNEQYAVDPNEQYAADLNERYAVDPNERYAVDPNEQYAVDSNEQYAADLNERYAVDPNERYAVDPNEQYAVDPNEKFAADPNERYAVDPNETYAIDPTVAYPTDSNEHYATDPNGRYPSDSNEHYAIDPNEHHVNDPNKRYPSDTNEHYTNDPNEQYADIPNEQYGYYENQPYQNDPSVPYSNSGNEHYDYGADQGYRDDPNERFEHDPNQQYAHDSNQQYELDPNQEYELDPNRQYQLDQNQQYEHAQNDHYEVDPNQHDPNEYLPPQLQNNSEQAYDGLNSELASLNQDYPKAAANEQNQMDLATSDSHIEGLSNLNVIGAGEYSTKGNTKNKDVIKALLESDTESTIERNPSNNTESDFDFN